MATTNPVVSSLPDYVQQNREPLIAEAIVGARTIDHLTIQAGVKGSAAINLVDSDVTLDDGTKCGWTPKGTTTMTQRVIATGQIKINMAYCDKLMIGKYTEEKVRIAATGKELPFEQIFMESVNRDIKSKLDTMIWQGDKMSGGANKNCFDGFIKILTDASAPTQEISASTSNYDAVLQMLAAIPASELVEDTCIFAAPSFVAAYMQELVAKNLFHYVPSEDYDTIQIPGSKVKLCAVEGLEGAKKLVAGRKGNMFYGCDMLNDMETYDFFYSRDNREFRLAIEFNAGVQVAFPDKMVLGNIAEA